jgi:ATP-dependent Clp protease ATP-binding subunit ClpX
MTEGNSTIADQKILCSFCNKSNQDVALLIAGPCLGLGKGRMYICNECVEICQQIVKADRKPAKAE